jgi:hypothetical protein
LSIFFYGINYISREELVRLLAMRKIAVGILMMPGVLGQIRRFGGFLFFALYGSE